MSNATTMQDLRKTSKLPAKEAGFGNVKAFFESQKSTLLDVLPKHVSADRMLKIALGAMRTTPKLMQCTTESLFGAIVQCSQLGLEPNTPLGHAYLIPFEKRAKQGNQWVTVGTEVQIIFGYKGLIDLARRSGQIVSISAHEVCSKDHFAYQYGLDEKLEHRPAMGERGDLVAFYAVAKLVGGGHAFEVMSVSQINEIRDKSAEKNRAKRDSKGNLIITGPWADHYVEMGRKTVLRRLFKYLPISIELATAVALDNRAGTEAQDLGDVLTGDYQVMDEDQPQLEQEQLEPAAEQQEPEQPAESPQEDPGVGLNLE